MGNMERHIAQHYQLPIISYRDAVWPSFANPRPLLPCFWNGISHPDAVGHLLFGDVVAYGLLRSLSDGRDGAEACNARQSPKKFHQRLASVRYCAPPTPGGNASSAPGTYMTTDVPAGFQPLGVTGAWTFREDVAGKPGMIGQACDCTQTTLENFRQSTNKASRVRLCSEQGV